MEDAERPSLSGSKPVLFLVASTAVIVALVLMLHAGHDGVALIDPIAPLIAFVVAIFVLRCVRAAVVGKGAAPTVMTPSFATLVLIRLAASAASALLFLAALLASLVDAGLARFLLRSGVSAAILFIVIGLSSFSLHDGQLILAHLRRRRASGRAE